jgi:pimeloyl-ACP methyl ester carboxylesterase
MACAILALGSETVKRLMSSRGVTVSYETYGSGPALVLVHGSFSNHTTNWEFVKPMFGQRFTVSAVARRGRGDTDATKGHSLNDEVLDVVDVIRAVNEPVFLLGHSYGAHCALGAAALAPDLVRKLVLYEAAWPSVVSRDALAHLEELAASGQWDRFATTFFQDSLFVPVEDLDALSATDLWPPILADAPASLGDLRALTLHQFKPERFSKVTCPVLLQIGSQSPRNLYVTDALAAVLPDARIEPLEGQAHEGMTTAPALYAEAVAKFLLGS